MEEQSRAGLVSLRMGQRRNGPPWLPGKQHPLRVDDVPDRLHRRGGGGTQGVQASPQSDGACHAATAALIGNVVLDLSALTGLTLAATYGVKAVRLGMRGKRALQHIDPISWKVTWRRSANLLQQAAYAGRRETQKWPEYSPLRVW